MSEENSFLEGKIEFHKQQAAQKRTDIKKSSSLQEKENLNDEALKHDKAEIAIRQELKEPPSQKSNK